MAIADYGAFVYTVTTKYITQESSLGTILRFFYASSLIDARFCLQNDSQMFAF